MKLPREHVVDYRYSPLDCPSCARRPMPQPIVCPDCGVDNALKGFMQFRARAREREKEIREGEVLDLAQTGAQVVANRRAGGAAAAQEREARKDRIGWRSRALALDAKLRREEPGLSRKERAARVQQALRPVTLAFDTVYDALKPSR